MRNCVNFHLADATDWRSPNRHRQTIGIKKEPRIGLVLGGGGAKVAAHIGILRVLSRAGIPIDLVAGSSGGCLVGLFHCDGICPDSQIECMKREFVPRRWLQWVPGGQYVYLANLLRRGIMRRVIERNVRARTFEDLGTTFCVATTDLMSGESVIHSRGKFTEPVLASMSIPGLMPPVVDGNRMLVDGSVLNDLPVQALKEQGADLVIAVDLAGDPSQPWSRSSRRPSPADVMRRSWTLQQQRLARRHQSLVDVFIHPDTSRYNLADFGRLDEFVRAGEESAARALPDVFTAINSFRQATLPTSSAAARCPNLRVADHLPNPIRQ